MVHLEFLGISTGWRRRSRKVAVGLGIHGSSVERFNEVQLDISRRGVIGSLGGAVGDLQGERTSFNLLNNYILSQTIRDTVSNILKPMLIRMIHNDSWTWKFWVDIIHYVVHREHVSWNLSSWRTSELDDAVVALHIDVNLNFVKPNYYCGKTVNQSNSNGFLILLD